MQKSPQGCTAVRSAGKVALFGHAIGYGNAGDAGIPGGYGAVFGVFDDETFFFVQAQALLSSQEEIRSRFDGVTIRSGEYAGKACEYAQALKPALHPAAG